MGERHNDQGHIATVIDKERPGQTERLNEAEAKVAPDHVGREGAPLGFGTMRLPVLGDGAVDIEQFKQMVDAFLEAGYRYFDTSYVYHNGQSEPAVREALVDRYPRESFLLATKLPQFMVKNEGDFERIFEEQLDKCGVGYFDFYLLHDVTNQTYDNNVQRFRLFEHAAEEKRAGRIRHLGYSHHDSAEMLDKILTEHPEIDFVQIILNYFDWDAGFVQSRECYDTIRRHGKQVVVMEPVKGGLLAKAPEGFEQRMRAQHPNWSPAVWALRFAASHEGVLAVLSGMSTPEQVRDNVVGLAGFEPLSESDTALLFEAAAALRASGPVGTADFSRFEGICANGIPAAAILDAYNSMMIQGGAGAELNYCYSWRYRAGIHGKESQVEGPVIDREGNDVTELLRTAEQFEAEHGLWAI